MRKIVLLVGEFTIDPGFKELRRDEEIIELEPLQFRVLVYLVHNRDHIVTKDELIESVWKVAVSDHALQRAIHAIRSALGDDPRRPRYIKTCHGSGYRFIAQVEERVVHTDETTSSERPRSGVPPFVGRSHLLDELESAYESSTAGRGNLVLLGGDAGIGKTRLVQEFLDRRSDVGDSVVARVRIHDSGSTPTFWSWQDAVRQVIEAHGAMALCSGSPRRVAELSRIVPELRSLPGAHDSPQVHGPDQRRFELMDGVFGLLEQAAAKSPLVIAFDDLHEADLASLEMLAFAARRLDGLKLLIIASYRPGEISRSKEFSKVFGKLFHEPVCRRVMVQGLGSEDVSSLVEQTMSHSVESSTSAMLFEWTKGNPLFLSFCMAEARRRLGDEESDEASHDLFESILSEIPDELRDAIGFQMGDLSDPCGELLGYAAVIGREFEIATLARSVDMKTNDFLDALEEAEQRGLIEGSCEQGIYAFQHALIRESLYQQLSATRRIRMHLAVAEAIEQVHWSDINAYVDTLAGHYFEALPAGAAEPATKYLMKAAKKARATYAYEDARLLYDRAVIATEGDVPAAPERLARALMGRGEAEQRSGDHAASRETFSRVVAIGRKYDDPVTLAEGALGVAGLLEFSLGNDMDHSELLEEALAELPPEQLRLRALILSRLAMMPPNREVLTQRERVSEEAVTLAESLGDDPVVLVHAYVAKACAAMRPEDLDERLEIVDKLRTLSMHDRFTEDDAQAADPEAWAYAIEYGARVARGEQREAKRCLEQMAQAAERLGDPFHGWLAEVYGAYLVHALGHLDEAERLADAAFEKGQAAGHMAAGLAYGLQKLLLSVDRNDTKSLSTFLGSVNESVWMTKAELDVLLIFCNVALGRFDEARVDFRRIADGGFERIEKNSQWLLSMMLLAESCYEVGTRDDARALYRVILPYVSLIASDGLIPLQRGSMAGAAAMLADKAGYPEHAIQHAEAALKMNRDSGNTIAVETIERLLGRLSNSERERDGGDGSPLL